MATFGLLLWVALAMAGDVDVRNEPTGLVLRNEGTTIVLDKERKGAIVSLRDNATGQEFIAPRPAPDLFWLAVSEQGDASGTLAWLGSSSASAVAYAVEDDGAGRRARLTFTGIGGRALQAECLVSVRDGEESVLYDIVVSGNEALVLEDVCYPIVMLRAPLGEDKDRGTLMAGLTKGGLFEGPDSWPVGATIYARQPGGLAAQFACYYGARAGCCSATRDSKGFPKVLQVRRTEAGLECVWRRPCFHDLSTRFEMGYPVAVTTFRSSEPAVPTDWRDGAELYKTWALRQPWCERTLSERDDLPGWLKDGPAMVRFDRGWLGRPDRIQGWLKDYWQALFPQAPLIVAFWGWERVAPWVSPDYFPPYPSEEGLQRCVGAVREAGGHPFFWPSGYHWTVTCGKRKDGTFEWDNRESFDKVGAPHAIADRDGSLWGWDAFWLEGGTNRALCRGDPWTRRWLDDIAVELTKHGADLIQVDQVVGGGAPAEGRCYSRQHGHPPGPGLWDAEAFADQLRTMHEACGRLNPQIVLGFEEPQELYLQQVGIQDYRDCEQPWSPPNPTAQASVFGYLYHEFVPCFQSNPHAGDRLMMAYCLVNGQVPHVVPHWPVEPSPALRNGSFEDWAGGVPEGWEHVKGYRGQAYAGQAYADGAVRHGGGFSLRLENMGADDIAQVSQNVSVGPHALQPGKVYRLSLWSRAPELSRANNAIAGAFDADWKALGTWAIPIVHGNDWRRGEVELRIPPGAVRLRIMLHVAGPARVWIDDAELEEREGGAYGPAMLAGLPADHGLALQWVRLFHGEARPYLLFGWMVRPPRLEAQSGGSAFVHNAYRAPDGTEAVIAVNVTDERQECRLTWDGRELRAAFGPWEAKLIRKP